MQKKYCKKNTAKKKWQKKEKLRNGQGKQSEFHYATLGGRVGEKREQDTLNLNYENQGGGVMGVWAWLLTFVCLNPSQSIQFVSEA